MIITKFTLKFADEFDYISFSTSNLLSIYPESVSLSEVNYDYTHIIATFSLGSINIWRQQGVKKSLANFS